MRAPPRGLPAGGLHSLTGLYGQVPIALFFRLRESFNIGPCGRGFELSRRRKKRAIGTCPYSPVSEWSPPAGRPRGGALTRKIERKEGEGKERERKERGGKEEKEKKGWKEFIWNERKRESERWKKR